MNEVERGEKIGYISIFFVSYFFTITLDPVERTCIVMTEIICYVIDISVSFFDPPGCPLFGMCFQPSLMRGEVWQELYDIDFFHVTILSWS